MREQIAELMESYEGTDLDGADQILTLIREKIEKVENPYACNEDWILTRRRYEEARYAILKAMND